MGADRFTSFLEYLGRRGVSAAPDETRSHKFYLHRLIRERYSLWAKIFELQPSFIVDVYGVVEDHGDGIGVELWGNAGRRVRDVVESYAEDERPMVVHRAAPKTSGILKDGKVAMA